MSPFFILLKAGYLLDRPRTLMIFTIHMKIIMFTISKVVTSKWWKWYLYLDLIKLFSPYKAALITQKRR